MCFLTLSLYFTFNSIPFLSHSHSSIDLASYREKVRNPHSQKTSSLTLTHTHTLLLFSLYVGITERECVCVCNEEKRTLMWYLLVLLKCPLSTFLFNFNKHQGFQSQININQHWVFCTLTNLCVCVCLSFWLGINYWITMHVQFSMWKLNHLRIYFINIKFTYFNIYLNCKVNTY